LPASVSTGRRLFATAKSFGRRVLATGAGGGLEGAGARTGSPMAHPLALHQEIKTMPSTIHFETEIEVKDRIVENING
tara:strand:- start:163 stop:396 length:234 start_codon:yes stop_codon:yes gene_type:complete